MAYTRVNWQDLPSTATPRNATNLNKMDAGIKANDDKLLGNAPMGDVVVDSIRSKNMFEKNQSINGSLNATTGAYTYQNYIVVSNYIWLKAGTYTIKMNNPSNMYLHTSCSYNSSKTYVSTLWSETTNTQKTFTLNSDNYVRFSFRNTSYSSITPNDVANTNIQLELGSAATTYSPYQELNIIASPQDSILKGEKYKFDSFIIYIGTIVVSFSSGIANVDVTNLHLLEKPFSVIATISSEKYGIRYDFDNSTATSLKFELFNGSGGTYNKTGNVRFSILVSGKIAN